MPSYSAINANGERQPFGGHPVPVRPFFHVEEDQEEGSGEFEDLSADFNRSREPSPEQNRGFFQPNAFE